MNRTIATALIALTAAVAGQAYAAPDAYEPTVALSGPARVRAEVAVEGVQAAKLNGAILGADTLVTAQTAPLSRDRAEVRTEAVNFAHNGSGILLNSPQ